MLVKRKKKQVAKEKEEMNENPMWNWKVLFKNSLKTLLPKALEN